MAYIMFCLFIRRRTRQVILILASGGKPKTFHPLSSPGLLDSPTNKLFHFWGIHKYAIVVSVVPPHPYAPVSSVSPTPMGADTTPTASIKQIISCPMMRKNKIASIYSTTFSCRSWGGGCGLLRWIIPTGCWM